MKYTIILFLLILTCGLSAQVNSEKNTFGQDTIKDPSELLKEIDDMFGGSDQKAEGAKGKESRSKNAKRETEASLDCNSSLVANSCSGQLVELNTTYFYEKDDVRYAGGEDCFLNGLIVGSNVVASSYLLSPWVFESSIDEDKKLVPGEVNDKAGNSLMFEESGKGSIALAETTDENNISANVYNKDIHKTFVVISTGTVDDKLYKDSKYFDSIEDINITRIESSYDRYHGSFVFSTVDELGIIKIELLALGVPSTDDIDSKVYRLQKSDVEDINSKGGKKKESKSKKKMDTGDEAKKTGGKKKRKRRRR